MKNILFTGAAAMLLLLFSCSANRKIKSDSKAPCVEMEKFISKNWTIDTLEKTFLASSSFFDSSNKAILLSKFQSCATAISEDHCKKLFGNPSRQDKSTFTYYQDTICLSPSPPICSYYVFHFNEQTKTLEAIYSITLQTERKSH